MTGLIALTLFASLTVFGVYLGAGKLSPKYHLHGKFTTAGQGLQARHPIHSIAGKAASWSTSRCSASTCGDWSPAR